MSEAVETILRKIEDLQQANEHLVIAIDGRCAAGKTTLAAHLQETLSCTVIHMDDFFLRPVQRTQERLNQPGGNVDYERFVEEVFIPLRLRETFSYRPYDCHTQKLTDPIRIMPHSITIVKVPMPATRRFGSDTICIFFSQWNQVNSFAASVCGTARIVSNAFKKSGFRWKNSIF